MGYVIGRVLNSEALPLSNHIPDGMPTGRIRNVEVTVAGFSDFRNGRLTALDPDELTDLHDLQPVFERALRAREALQFALSGTVILPRISNSLTIGADVSFAGTAQLEGRSPVLTTTATPIQATPWQSDVGFDTDLTIEQYRQLGSSPSGYPQLIGYLGLNVIHF